MKVFGARKHLQYQDLSPLLGRDDPALQLSSIVTDDTKLRDLAIIASERGALFFHDQHIQMSDFKVLMQKLGELTGKPATSMLHKHVFSSENNSHLGIPEPMDPEVYTVSSVLQTLELAHLLLTSGFIEQQEVLDSFLGPSDKKFASRSGRAE